MRADRKPLKMSAGLKAFYAERNQTYQKRNSEIAARESDDLNKNAPATKRSEIQKWEYVLIEFAGTSYIN